MLTIRKLSNNDVDFTSFQNRPAQLIFYNNMECSSSSQCDLDDTYPVPSGNPYDSSISLLLMESIKLSHSSMFTAMGEQF